MKVCAVIILSLIHTSLLWATIIKNPSYDEAPRPGFISDEIFTLDNQPWDFAIGDARREKVGVLRNTPFVHKINFGFAPESELSGLDYEALRPQGSTDIVWYQKTLKIPADWKGAILTLEGIDYQTELYVNNKYVSSHRGAFAPMEVNITQYLVPGKETTIKLRVEDDRLARGRSVGKQERRQYEGVIFYGNSTGAWKGAFLRKIDPENFIAGLTQRTNSNGIYSYHVDIGGMKKNHLDVEVLVTERLEKRILAKAKGLRGELKIPSIKPWTPETPNLYDVEIKLFKGGVVVDRIRSYTGFSDFTQKDGHFYLNGSPYYLRGVLNQMVFPRGLYTPDSKTANAHDILMIKKHGFNFQRVHQTTPRWRDIYDMEKMGVGWTLEMPSARDLRDPKALTQFIKEWKEIIKAYGHGHPGLFYFVPGNEDWGMLEDHDHWAPATDQERENFQLDLVKATLEVAPPGALVSPGDGWRQITGIKHGQSLPGIIPEQLILSAHDYRGSGNDLLNAYGAIPVNAPVGTIFPRNGKELILNGFEFPGHHVAPILGEFGGKSYAPPGIGNVFGYGHVYREIHDWARDSLLQLKAMGQLKIMRGGYVYTQVRDAGFKPHVPLPADRPAGELNGFLSADGTPKSDPLEWMKLNIQNQNQFEQNYNLYRSMEGLKTAGSSSL